MKREAESTDTRSSRHPLRRWLERAALVAVGVLLGVLAGRYLLPGSGTDGTSSDVLQQLAARQDAHLQQLEALTDERFRASQQVVLGQYLRLQRFRRFADLGLDLSLIVVARPGATRDEALAGDAAGRVLIPRVAVDSLSHGEWSRLADELDGYQQAVDPRVFDAFQTVRAFPEQHPWPAGGLAMSSRSEWSQPALIDRWTSLNKTLSSRVEGVLERVF